MVLARPAPRAFMGPSLAAFLIIVATPLTAQQRVENPMTALRAESGKPVVQVHGLPEALDVPTDRIVQFVDAETGAPRRPTAKEVAALLEAARAVPLVNGKPQIPIIELPDGALMAPLPPEYDVHHGEHDASAIVGRGP